MPNRNNGTVAIYAPFSRDADSIAQVLAPHGISTQSADSLQSLVDMLGDDTGAVLKSQEAL